MTRKRLTQICARRYRQATTKREKIRIRDEFIRLTGYNRSYVSWLLRYAGRKIRVGTRTFVVADLTLRIRRNRKRVYGEEVLQVLLRVWTLLDNLCSPRLKALLPKIVPKLEACGELEVDEETRERLLRIFRATIDR